MSLGTLPSEIILNIYRHVDESKDLAASSLSCRRLHLLLESLLYSYLQLRDRHGMALLVRTFLERPELAQHIKGLTEHYVPFTPRQNSETEVYRDILAPENHASVRELIEGTCVTSEESRPVFRALVRHKNLDRVGAFLLQLAHNVETLEIDESSKVHRYLQPFLSRAARLQQTSATPSRHSLSKLHSVSISRFYHFSYLNDILPYVQLKSVTSFELCGFICRDGQSPSQDCLAYPSSVEDLTINGASVTDGHLTAFLRCFPKLKRLQYDNYWATEKKDHDIYFRASSVYNGIKHLKLDLEQLILHKSCRAVSSWNTDYNFQPEIIEWLKKFQKLTHLDVTANVLLGRELNNSFGIRFYDTPRNKSLPSLLPTSLQYLIIRDCCEGLYDALHAILLSGTLTNLKTVLVMFTLSFEEQEGPRRWPCLLKEFHDRGIRLHLILGRVIRVSMVGNYRKFDKSDVIWNSRTSIWTDEDEMKKSFPDLYSELLEARGSWSLRYFRGTDHCGCVDSDMR